MDSDLSGHTAIVTGGESGIGRAIAVLLAEHGVKVVVGDVNPRAENDELFAKLGIVQVQCDLRHESGVRELIDHAMEVGGGVDILINNVGIELPKPITEVTEEDWNAYLDTNLKSAFFASKHAIPSMRERGRGSIVNVSSNAAFLPRPHDPVYTITKAALVTLTKTLALSYGHDGIRVNAICPGPVENTGMVETALSKAADHDAYVRMLVESAPLTRALGRLETPEEIAASVLYLVSDAAAMVTGTVIMIDGGKSLGMPPK